MVFSIDVFKIKDLRTKPPYQRVGNVSEMTLHHMKIAKGFGYE